MTTVNNTPEDKYEYGAKFQLCEEQAGLIQGTVVRIQRKGIWKWGSWKELEYMWEGGKGALEL